MLNEGCSEFHAESMNEVKTTPTWSKIERGVMRKSNITTSLSKSFQWMTTCNASVCCPILGLCISIMLEMASGVSKKCRRFGRASRRKKTRYTNSLQI